MEPRVPKFKIPLTMIFKNGRRQFDTVEQDSQEEIEACVENVLLTPLGSRNWQPEYGISDQTFNERDATTGGGADLHEIQNAISLYEPRAEYLLERDPTLLYQWQEDIDLILRNRPESIGED
jgi:phage baseplate assembly protein W